MDSPRPRLVFSAVAVMLFGAAWVQPTAAAANSLPTYLIPDICAENHLTRRDDSQNESQNEKVSSKQGIGIVSFITSIAAAMIIFAVQISLFALFRNKLARILYVYCPRLHLFP